MNIKEFNESIIKRMELVNEKLSLLDKRAEELDNSRIIKIVKSQIFYLKKNRLNKNNANRLDQLWEFYEDYDLFLHIYDSLNRKQTLLQYAILMDELDLIVLEDKAKQVEQYYELQEKIIESLEILVQTIKLDYITSIEIA